MSLILIAEGPVSDRPRAVSGVPPFSHRTSYEDGARLVLPVEEVGDYSTLYVTSSYALGVRSMPPFPRFPPRLCTPFFRLQPSHVSDQDQPLAPSQHFFIYINVTFTRSTELWGSCSVLVDICIDSNSFAVVRLMLRARLAVTGFSRGTSTGTQ
jgi:hypothetical protein